jgi:hypothetical protein
MSECSVMGVSPAYSCCCAYHGFSNASCLRMTADPWPASKHITWLLVLARLLPILYLMLMLIVSWACYGIPGPHAACQAAAVCCVAASAAQADFFVALSATRAAAAATTLAACSSF